ncbi:hypothetical protein [Nocardia sp. alder85J]|uniref:hypothetical protein n=1 Tax=Nocardia sp. alder85J TaxID=2862949 RepID=UPI001CD517BD|nr:hypothetical protein [Nocardia sp. alder85J]MCX4097792.1 hypothetical protein [Nocardia sp. alder85J]
MAELDRHIDEITHTCSGRSNARRRRESGDECGEQHRDREIPPHDENASHPLFLAVL